ncbi:hypothetical protein ACJX0J_031427, partial [Zea mays]
MNSGMGPYLTSALYGGTGEKRARATSSSLIILGFLTRIFHNKEMIWQSQYIFIKINPIFNYFYPNICSTEFGSIKNIFLKDLGFTNLGAKDLHFVGRLLDFFLKSKSYKLFLQKLQGNKVILVINANGMLT